MTETEAIDIRNMSMRERVIHYRLMTFQYAPYLTPYVYSLVLIERPGIGTMAVDKQGRMYYDPAFVQTLTLEQGGYVVLHEAWHLILRHCHRSKDIIGENPTPRQRGRLNVAYDCVVWELMEAIKHHAPPIEGGDIVTFPNLKARYPKLQRNMLPQQIYSLMLEQDEEEERKREAPPPMPREEGWMDAPESDEHVPSPLDDLPDAPEQDDAEQDGESEDRGDGFEQGDAEQDGGEQDGKPSDDAEIGSPGRPTRESGESTDGSGEPTSDGGDPTGDDSTGGSSGEGGEGDGSGDKWEDLNQVGGGSCADGDPRPYEEEPNDNWDSFIEDQLMEQVEKAIEEQENRPHIAGRGNVPGCLKEAIKNKLRPQPNPWDKLRAACGLAAANPRGRPDFTYQRPNRRQFAIPGAPILKGTRKYAPKAVVILDSSGSMTTECKVKCLNVVAQGLKAVGEFRVIVGDMRVQSDVRVSAMSDKFDFKGGGGTDMVTLIRYAEEKYKPDLIVLGTDGGTLWPDKPTKAQLIIALTQEVWTPKWATTVRIPDEGKATR